MSIPKLIGLHTIPKFLGFFNETPNNSVVYHYTDLNAFINIFSNRELWISNIDYMNDKEEFSNGLNICIEVLKQYLEIDCFKYKGDFERLLAVVSGKSKPELMGIDTDNIFSISFCSEGDILTQWNCYGTNGVSIGFQNTPNSIEDGIALVPSNLYNELLKKYGDDPKEIKPDHEQRLFLNKVIYDDEEKRNLFHSFFDYIVEEADKANDSLLIFQDDIVNLIYYLCIHMKNSGFAHEKESRVVFVNPAESQAEISYRTRNNAVLPFIKYKVLDLNCHVHQIFPISEIVLAPNPSSDFTLKSVKYFLKANGYDYLVDKVRVSSIPFRS